MTLDSEMTIGLKPLQSALMLSTSLPLQTRLNTL